MHRHGVPGDEVGDGVGTLEVVEVLAPVDPLVLRRERQQEGRQDAGLPRILFLVFIF